MFGGDLLRLAHVLIADQDKFLLATYSSHLRKLGAAVSTAEPGWNVWNVYVSAVPDVLVLEPGLLWGGGDGGPRPVE